MGEEGKRQIDWVWFNSLVDLFQKTPCPETWEEAIKDLDKLGVDTAALKRVLEAKKAEWEGQDFLGKLGLEPSFMPFALMLFAYSLDYPEVFRPVNRLFSTDARTDTDSPEVQAGMKFMKMVDAAYEELPNSQLYQGSITTIFIYKWHACPGSYTNAWNPLRTWVLHGAQTSGL